jgi:1-deoxy-D-xylulose-5-phosphate synthase
MLGRLQLPQDLKTLNVEELEALGEEIRQQIVAVCLKNGGHLGASLGAVDFTLALHRIFDSPKDKIVWDVGHQAYAHKLLTGRFDRFDSLRTTGGLSGFLTREESEHDVFGAGHSSTALSAALGFAYRSDNWTVAVVGDGGLTAGVSLEALNNIQSPNHFGPFLIVLNDNQMSISENVGGIHHLLSNGQGADFFQLFGLEYVGPLNGHDLPTLLATLNGIRTARPDRPILLHLHTQKGKGYSPAEARPQLFHGVGPVQVSGKTLAPTDVATPSTERSWSDVFGEAITRAADRDPKVVAVTAAMSDGTGLLPFSKRHSERFFDVGIAEPHAVTFSAGLAANGWKPICAIYSTFLQRALDALIHDVALQKLPVIFAVDRAGLVGADGPTHHGVFDLTIANAVPEIHAYVPEVAGDLSGALGEALSGGFPAMIRYPRGKAKEDPKRPFESFRISDSEGEITSSLSGKKRWIISFGPIGTRLRRILAAVPESSRKSWIHISIIRAKPVSEDLLRLLRAGAADCEKVLFFEEGSLRGGFSAEMARELGVADTKIFAYPDRFIRHGSPSDLEEEIGWSDVAIAQALGGDGA